MGDRIAVFNQGKPEQIGTPEDIYERPVSRFVADFIGETNFITRPDGSVDAIRPERISLSGPEPEFASGTLTSAVYMGTDFRCTVELPDGTHIAVRISPPFDAAGFSIGQTVTLHAAPESIRRMAPEPS